MARLPDAMSLGSSPVPQPSGIVAGYSPVDITGRAAANMESAGGDLQQASATMQHAAAYVQEANKRQDQMVAVAAANKLHEQAINLHLGEGGFNGVNGIDAVGKPFVERFRQKFDDIKSDIQGSLQNDNQRQIFQQHAAPVTASFTSSLFTHQAQQTDKFNDATENATIDLARKQMFANPLDPQALQGGMAQINWALDQKAKRQGWSQVVATDTRAKFVEKVYEDMGQVLVERDPYASLQALNKRLGVGVEAGNTGVAAFDNMPADKLVTLRHRALSVVTQEQNKLEAAEKKRLHDAEQAYKGLLDFTTSGQMVSPDYARQIEALTDKTPFADTAKQLITASYAGAMHGTKPLPQQEAELRQLDAQVAQQGSNPDVKKLVDHMRAITNQQTTAYKENPWAAATRFGRQPDVQEQPISDASAVPKVISQRLPLMSGVEVYAGRPISPLQPAEAQAFTEKLKSLPPQERATVLGQTGVMLSGPRAMALAEQIDKHDTPLALSLKMGLDGTTGGRVASGLVQIGAQGLKDKTVKKDDSALAGWRAEIAPLVRGSMGDDKLESDIIEAAYYIRAAQEVEGIGGPEFTKGIGSGAKDAVAMAAGYPLERAGVKTLLPRGMKEREFDDKLKTYTPEKLKELAPEGVVYVRGTPVKVEQISSHLTEYGVKLDARTKRYTPIIRGAFVTLDKAGSQPLQLEVR